MRPSTLFNTRVLLKTLIVAKPKIKTQQKYFIYHFLVLLVINTNTSNPKRAHKTDVIFAVSLK